VATRPNEGLGAKFTHVRGASQQVVPRYREGELADVAQLQTLLR
jgi:hypothetical protein